jgi:acetate kinase
MSIGVGYECLSNKENIGAYTAVLNGLDAIILLQESAKTLLHQEISLYGYGVFCIKLDDAKNEIRSKEIREINAIDSKTKYW